MSNDDSAYLVSFEARDLLGRITESVAAAFLSEELAEQFAIQFNTDPATEGRTADVHEVTLYDRVPPNSQRPRGMPGRAHKLTAPDVIEIRQRHAAGESYGVLAAAYGVNESSIQAVISGKSWKWVR